MRRERIAGVNPVLEALRKGEREFEKVYIAREVYSKEIREIIDLCKHKNIPVFFEKRDVISKMSGTSRHRGVLAITTLKRYVPLEYILEYAENRNEKPFILILDRVEDPGNFGAIIRTAECAGVHGIIVLSRCSAGITDTVARTSAGAVEYVNIARVTNIASTIEWLKKRGVWIYGLDLRGKEEYNRLLYQPPLAIVVGGEGEGIRRSVLGACDITVKIPLFGHVNSLNVSVATGVILFEILRQIRIK